MYKIHVSRNLNVKTGILLMCFLISFGCHINITYGDRPNARELTANVDTACVTFNEFTDTHIPKGFFRLVRAASTTDLNELNELLYLTTFITDLSEDAVERADMSEEELTKYLEVKKAEAVNKMSDLDNLKLSAKVNKELSVITLLIASVFYHFLPKPKE